MSVIAVFVGGFLVFLTFSVAVAERTPTYGILRALGARPAQVRRVVLTEAGVLGLAASLVGLVVGRLIAGASLGLVESLLALDLPPLGMPIGPAVVGVVVGVSRQPGRRLAPRPARVRRSAPSMRWPRVRPGSSTRGAGGLERRSWWRASRWASAAPAWQCAGSPP